MAKRVVIVHGWEGSPEKNWMPWLKRELEKREFSVLVPAMPDSNNPKCHAWLEHLKKTVGDPDEETYLVGHSLGCITILRYLESLGEKQKIGGAVLVAGFTSNLGYVELDSFFPKHVDWKKIMLHCSKFVAIHSDNDPYVSTHYGDFFKENLGAELIIEHDKSHFNERAGIFEVPSVLDSVLKIAV